MRSSFPIALCALALLRAGSGAAATGPDTRFANYAFASELGSGVYEINGRTIQVYQLQPAYRLRTAARLGSCPGLQFIFPLTLGFFDFRSEDLVHLHVPTSIGALSVEPGVQLDYWVHEDWHVYPYVKAGGTFASSAAVNAAIYGIGVRSDYRFTLAEGAGLWRAELTHAAVHYHGDLPNDSFTRLRDGVELRHGFGAPWRERRLEAGLYGLMDVYADAPSGPGSGISARTLQFEAGVMLGVNPMWNVRGLRLPRFGIGYRVAGVFSGWRLVIGEPF